MEKVRRKYEAALTRARVRKITKSSGAGEPAGRGSKGNWEAGSSTGRAAATILGPGTIRPVPSLSADVVDLYTRLLRDEKALAQEIEENLEARLGARRATFGGRGLCPFAMPQFVAREDYDHVRIAARGIYGATLKVWKALGPALHDLVGLTAGRARTGRPRSWPGLALARSLGWTPS